MKKKMVFVAAPPACGKTYVSELIAKSVGNVVYLDKDDLADLVRTSFEISGNEMDMDGDFYINNIRSAEYSTLLNIAFSALRFENLVLINAPFGKEVRNTEYMRMLKEKANENDAELFVVWITTSQELCYERMKKRNSTRDIHKLNNWEDYVKKINFSPPFELEKKDAVDRLILFDTNNEETIRESLDKTLKILQESGK
ncbi:MAG: AAA family ATPase [Clostridia bacterium]|nr:AAA family ATPase [Clostridia bacterium]